MDETSGAIALEPTAGSPANEHVLRELEPLVQETFALWSHKRMGFSWRNYYYEHTLRVRSLCLKLADEEGADPTVLGLAALLHDVTKRYDGPFLTDGEGKRVVDQRGLWVSGTVLPDRGGNIVTALYEFHDEFREPHSESGAHIAQALLLLKGMAPDFAHEVADVIRAHLQPTHTDARDEDLSIEQQILRDADLIDANFGLVAFYRNVQIHVHRRVQETGAADLAAYVEYVPNWLSSKFSFFDKLHTASARRRAKARHERCFACHRLMVREAATDFELGRTFGLLGVFDYFTSTIDDPDFFAELAHLEDTLLPGRRTKAESLDGDARARATEAVGRGERFCRDLRQEAEGVL